MSDTTATAEVAEPVEIPKVIRRRSAKPAGMTVTSETLGEPIEDSFLPGAEAGTKPPRVIGRGGKKIEGSGTAVAAPAKGEIKPPKELAPIAKEVNVRLEKASKLEADAADHRLAAALKLAEAKEICKRSGVSFQTWSEANVKDAAGNKIGYQVVRKLANIGEKENPEEELARQREAQAERAAASREKKAAEVEALKEKVAEPPSPFEPVVVKDRDPALLVKDMSSLFERLPDAAKREDALRDLFAFLEPAEALSALKSVADDLGCTVVVQ